MQPGILDERACLYLPAGTADEQPHEDAEFRPFPIILFLLLIRCPTMESREERPTAPDGVCAASILDKADNGQAVGPLFHSPSSVSAFQQPLLDE